MPVRVVDDKSSDTLVVVSGEGFWTGSSTLPHLHHYTFPRMRAPGIHRADLTDTRQPRVGLRAEAQSRG